MSDKTRYQELLAQLETLKKEIESERSVLVRDAVSTCMRLIAEFNLTAYDLGLVKTHTAKPVAVKQSEKTFPVAIKKAPKPPKYVNPENGKTWNGNGKPPSWLEGNRDDYLIGKATEKPARATQNNGHAHH
jgi:DNA-binding protein H-NS